MRLPATIEIAILAAVELEVRGLTDILTERRAIQLAGETLYFGMLQGKTALVGTTGIGKVNAAVTTASLLQHFAVSQVWNIGCAGYYREGPLHVGDVLVTQDALFGDEGVLTLSGAQSLKAIGIPALTRQEQALFEGIPAGPIIDRVRQAAPSGTYRLTPGQGATTCSSLEQQGSSVHSSFNLVYGPALCVGMVSGDRAVAARRFLDHGAFAENMEGSAAAQTCLRLETPFVECRGMSNEAGDRDKKNWHLKEAIDHCHAIVMTCLSSEVEIPV